MYTKRTAWASCCSVLAGLSVSQADPARRVTFFDERRGCRGTLAFVSALVPSAASKILFANGRRSPSSPCRRPRSAFGEGWPAPRRHLVSGAAMPEAAAICLHRSVVFPCAYSTAPLPHRGNPRVLNVSVLKRCRRQRRAVRDRSSMAIRLAQRMRSFAPARTVGWATMTTAHLHCCAWDKGVKPAPTRYR
jgi:hypothetical protein